MQNRKIKNLNTIIDEMQNYLQQKSLDQDMDYAARQNHFDELIKLLNNNELVTLSEHIKLGLEKFDQFFFTSRYHAYLQELNLNLTTEKNSDDELKRINRLAAVILSKDEVRIRNAIQEGCLAVINTPFRQDPSNNAGIEDGTLPIEIAMKSKSFPVFSVLIEFGADVNISKNAIQHFLNNQHDRQIPILFMAICHRNIKLVRYILECNIKVDAASYLHAKKLAKSDDATENEVAIFDMIYKTEKIPRKEHKKSIMSASNDTLFSEQKPSMHETLKNPILAISSQFYTETTEIKDIFMKRLTDIFNHTDSVLKPLLIIVGMGALGIRKHAQPGSYYNPLKTILDERSKDLNNLVIDSDDTGGIYTKKNSVYVADLGSYTLAIMLHEWKHYTDHEVFGSSEMKLNSNDQMLYDRVREHVRNSIARFSETNFITSTIKASFMSVFDGSYSNDKIDYELLARVPEVIGALGTTDGMDWLKTNTPYLLQFYEVTYNKYINEHIEKMQKLYSQESISTYPHNLMSKPRSTR